MLGRGVMEGGGPMNAALASFHPRKLDEPQEDVKLLKSYAESSPLLH